MNIEEEIHGIRETLRRWFTIRKCCWSINLIMATLLYGVLHLVSNLLGIYLMVLQSYKETTKEKPFHLGQEPIRYGIAIATLEIILIIPLTLVRENPPGGGIRMPPVWLIKTMAAYRIVWIVYIAYVWHACSLYREPVILVVEYAIATAVFIFPFHLNSAMVMYSLARLIETGVRIHPWI